MTGIPEGVGFWDKVERKRSGGRRACWLWTGTKDRDGYGLFAGRRAHRVAYEAEKGPIPPGLVVRHRCNVRACVNPDHLEVGTQGENIRDASRAGRMNQNRRVIPREDDAKIAARHAAGESLRSIGKTYGVSAGTIFGVVARAGTQAQRARVWLTRIGIAPEVVERMIDVLEHS